MTSWTAACQTSLSFTISQNLLKLTSMESVMSSNHLILCHTFFLLPSIFLASGYLPMSQLFASGGQSIGASSSALPINIQSWFLLRLTGLISLLSKELLQVFSSTTVWKCQFLDAQPSRMTQTNKEEEWFGVRNYEYQILKTAWCYYCLISSITFISLLHVLFHCRIFFNLL